MENQVDNMGISPEGKDVRREDRKRIGLMLKESRKAAGLTIMEVADLTGIDKNIISRTEGGRANTGIDAISAMARAYGKYITLSNPDVRD